MVDKKKNAKKRFMNCLLVAEKIVVFLLNIVKFFMERRKWIFLGDISRRLGMKTAKTAVLTAMELVTAGFSTQDELQYQTLRTNMEGEMATDLGRSRVFGGSSVPIAII